MDGEEKTAEQLAADIRAMEAEAAKSSQGDKDESTDKDSDKNEQKNQDKEEDKGDDNDFDFEDPFEEVKDEKKPTKKEEKEDDKEEGADDELSDEDKALIDRRVKEQTDLIRQEAAEKEQRDEKWNKYVSENPHLEKYADNIKPYMHKMYNTLVKDGIAGVKVSETKAFDAIVGMILGKSMLKIGARIASQATKKAADGSQSADTQRNEQKRSTGIPNAADMSTEDFRKLENQVINGEFKVA